MNKKIFVKILKSLEYISKNEEGFHDYEEW